MKHVNDWKLSKLLKSKSKREINFSGATTAYTKPTLKRNTDKVILHIGTNNVRQAKEPLEIASNIFDLAKTCRETGWNAIISEILLRGDKLNNKSIRSKHCIA